MWKKKTKGKEMQRLYHRVGSRSKVCFSPDDVRASIITCGVLCSGLNIVINEIIDGLWI